VKIRTTRKWSTANSRKPEPQVRRKFGFPL
jgi:hypothetical protein